MLKLLAKYMNWLKQYGKEAILVILIDLSVRVLEMVFLAVYAFAMFVHRNRRDIGVNFIAGLLVWMLTTAA